MSLQATVQVAARQGWDDVLQRHEDLVMRQPRVDPEGMIAASSRREAPCCVAPWGHGQVFDRRPGPPLRYGFLDDPWHRASAAVEACDRCSSAGGVRFLALP
jgi:hypothetical protein